jgi:hypothetical protein
LFKDCKEGEVEAVESRLLLLHVVLFGFFFDRECFRFFVFGFVAVTADSPPAVDADTGG